MSGGFLIAPDDLTARDVTALLALHLERMHQWSPAGKVRALPSEKLRAPGVSFFAARVGGELAAVGALKALDEASGEIKSMRAADAWRGRGAGKAILLALVAEARERGYAWVGLETGRHPEFESAHRLYAAHGFRECPPFADYVSDDFSLCMRLELS
jgi:putative acetyltransferase